MTASRRFTRTMDMACISVQDTTVCREFAIAVTNAQALRTYQIKPAELLHKATDQLVSFTILSLDTEPVHINNHIAIDMVIWIVQKYS